MSWKSIAFAVSLLTVSGFAAAAEDCPPRMVPHSTPLAVTETVAIPAGDRLDAFGRTADGQTVHRYRWTAQSAWTEWEILSRPGDRIAGGPWAASWAPGRYDVLALAPDGTLLHLYMQAGRSQWICYENLWPQIRFKELRTFRSDGPERLEISAVAESGTLLRMRHVGAWREWENLSAPSPVDADVAIAKANVDWAWNDHGPCSRLTLCLTHFDSFGINLDFLDGTSAPFAKIWRGAISAHACIERALAHLSPKDGSAPDRAMAVQWVMASQIHNKPVMEWMRAHPDAVIAALRTL